MGEGRGEGKSTPQFPEYIFARALSLPTCPNPRGTGSPAIRPSAFGTLFVCALFRAFPLFTFCFASNFKGMTGSAETPGDPRPFAAGKIAGDIGGAAPVPAWFCLRTQPKHEHIAAGHLKSEPGIEVYLPRIRFKRSTRRGPVWFTEALFPNYLFARFDLALNLRKRHHIRGVRGVVHFGEHWPAIPDGVIAELRATVGADEV